MNCFWFSIKYKSIWGYNKLGVKNWQKYKTAFIKSAVNNTWLITANKPINWWRVSVLWLIIPSNSWQKEWEINLRKVEWNRWVAEKEVLETYLGESGGKKKNPWELLERLRLPQPRIIHFLAFLFPSPLLFSLLKKLIFCICQVFSKSGMGKPSWMCHPHCEAQSSPIWW